MIGDLCPCMSGKTYESCCKPYHEGKSAPDVLSLMRSRYSGYFFHLGKYIIDTTHKDNVNYKEDKVLWEKEILDFCNKTTFKGLKIADCFFEKNDGWVIFIAYLEQEGKDLSFWEKSYFVKENGRWYYKGGLVKPFR